MKEVSWLHRVLTSFLQMKALSADPSVKPLSGHAKLYAKLVSAVPTMFYMDDSGAVHSLSAAGGVADSDIVFADITTNNVSTAKHGFTPKLPGDASKYLDGTGAYTVPAGGAGGGSFELVEAKVIMSDTTDVTFSGLDGDTDKSYWLRGRILMPTTGGIVNYTWRPNGVTSNQDSTAFSAFGSGTVNDRQSELLLLRASITSTPAHLTFSIFIDAKKDPNSVAAIRTYSGTAGGYWNGVGVTTQVGGGWNESSTNLTSIVVHGGVANGILNGSTINLYKVSD